jgi:hypothetical protein
MAVSAYDESKLSEWVHVVEAVARDVLQLFIIAVSSHHLTQSS